MPKYYCIVSSLMSAKVDMGLSCALYSKNYGKAYYEMREWERDPNVNGGLPVEFLGDEFRVVVVMSESAAKKVKYFRTFKHNRHTDPIWETLRGRELEERINARSKSIP